MLKKISSAWKEFSKASVNKKIFSAAILIGLLTFIVKLTGVSKELVVAWRFGTGNVLDAFLIALLIPNFLVNIVTGSFNAAFIPTYIRTREKKGREEAGRLLSSAIIWSLGILGVATLVIVLAAPFFLPIIGSAFNPEKLALTHRLLILVSPIIVLSGIVTIWGAVLNSEERFALTSVLPILIPLVTISLLVLRPSWGIYSMVLGLVSALILQLFFLSLILKKRGVALKLKWYGMSEDLKCVIRQCLPMAIGVILMGSTTVVDQTMAAMLPAGSVAALNYGNRIIAFPMGLICIALGTAVIPYFSKMTAQNDWTNIKRTLKRYLGLIILASIPIVLIFAVFSDAIVKVIFERGSFSASDTQIVGKVQFYYAFQIPFYVAGILGVRLISSMRKNQVLMWISGVNLVTNIVFNYLFMQWLGVAGIALSTSVVYFISFTLIFIYLNKRLTFSLRKTSV